MEAELEYLGALADLDYCFLLYFVQCNNTTSNVHRNSMFCKFIYTPVITHNYTTGNSVKSRSNDILYVYGLISNCSAASCMHIHTYYIFVNVFNFPEF